jgi:hypothetical protein
LVERYLAKVEVAGSTPVARSNKFAGQRPLSARSDIERAIKMGPSCSK